MNPTRSGLLGGLIVIALWALLWTWFLIGVTVAAAERQARHPRVEAARVMTDETSFEG